MGMGKTYFSLTTTYGVERDVTVCLDMPHSPAEFKFCGNVTLYLSFFVSLLAQWVEVTEEDLEQDRGTVSSPFADGSDRASAYSSSSRGDSKMSGKEKEQGERDCFFCFATSHVTFLAPFAVTLLRFWLTRCYICV